MSVDPHFFFKLCKIELNIFISSLILNTFLLIGEHFDKRIKYISPYITWLIFFFMASDASFLLVCGSHIQFSFKIHLH